MTTYRCPYCGDQAFRIKRVTSAGESSTEQQPSEKAIHVECNSCHWTGTVSETAGSHPHARVNQGGPQER